MISHKLWGRVHKGGCGTQFVKSSLYCIMYLLHILEIKEMFHHIVWQGFSLPSLPPPPYSFDFRYYPQV